MNKPKRDFFMDIPAACGLLLLSAMASAAVTWPTEQLLPSFSAPAQTQDLIVLREQPKRWEAEGPSLAHKTGRLETDGWLCQVGIDAPNNHMIYGPYDASLPAGPNLAEFRMKIDNNTANNDAVAIIDVRDAATGQELASQTVTRQQFTVAGNYTTFSLPFNLPAEGHAIELRVYWMGSAYLKVDWVGVTHTQLSDEMILFASLKGIVNKTQPRIFSYEGDAFAEGKYTWLQSLGLGWSEPADKWDLIEKYRNEIDGLVVFDSTQPATINLATTIAGDYNALIASPLLVSRLTAAPYNLPILVDLRGQFSSKLHVYQTLFNNYWPNLTHRLLIGLDPNVHRAALREYATALGAAVIWLDPEVAGESELLNNFLSSMDPGANYMGWWPEEGAGVERASQFGIATIASDWSTNLTVHSGMPRTINTKPIPPKPPLQNKIYVAFILSDGDNLQYVEHLMRKLWSNPDRGKVPIGWTVSPAMLDAMPGALNFYWETSTVNDNLISGPSGYGYTYPNSWPSAAQLDQFVAKTEDYTRRAGLRVVTVWNTIIGGIDADVGYSFANNAPSLLGLTAQNTGGGLTIYNGLPSMALSCNYCTDEQAMLNHIATAAAGWNGNEPRFAIIQAQPWTNVRPTSFLNVANSLNSDYVVVRPDHLFMLLREANGLTINPGGGTDITNLGGPISSQYTDWPAGEGNTNLIDNNVNTKYLTFHASGWVQYQAPSAYVVNRYTLTSANDVPERDPLSWTLQGSNDGNNWTTLDSRSGQDFPSRFQTREFTFSNADAYSHYRFNLNNNSGTILQLAEMELFGVAGGGGGFEQFVEAEAYTAMAGVQTEATTDEGGGLNVGWIDANDWMAYAGIHFPTTGTYRVEYRVASPSGSVLSLDLNAGQTQLGQLTIPATGGWQNWITISHDVQISAGTHDVGIFAPQGGWNINWFRITKL